MRLVALALLLLIAMCAFAWAEHEIATTSNLTVCIDAL